MSEPIDLDLVKLRATVRGWTIHPSAAVPGAFIVYCDKGLPRASFGYKNNQGRPENATLTAPRWTLARLLSEPPEGWTNYPDCCGGVIVSVLTWGVANDAVDDEVRATIFALERGVLDARFVVAPASGPEGLARLAERHKAAAELAYILAEIQP